MGSRKPFTRTTQPSYKTGGQSRFSAAIDISDLTKLVEQLDDLPVRVSRDVSDVHMDYAARLVANVFRSKMPESKASDRAKWSRLHAQGRKFASFPRTRSTINYVIRKYGKFAVTAFIGPEYPHGAKSYFDYYGTTSRQMSFWAVDKNDPKRYRARLKAKRRLSQEVQDATDAMVKKIMAEGIDRSVKMHMEGNVSG
jgi:hypothetical protein